MPKRVQSPGKKLKRRIIGHAHSNEEPSPTLTEAKNEQLHHRQRIEKELGDDRRRIAITTLPLTAECADKFDNDLSVNYILHNSQNWPGITRYCIGSREELLLSKPDTLVASATHPCSFKVAGEKAILLAPHGVKDVYFSSQSGSRTAASVMGKYKTPVVGFFGSVSPCLDFKLLEKVAAACPDLSFVFIGPIEADITLLSSYENVSFLGMVPDSEIGNYAEWVDVAMAPFLVNNLTVSLNPLTLLDYVACGLPIVSTNLPEVARYHEHVYNAANADEFVTSLRAAVVDSPLRREARREIAGRQSWRSRAELVGRQLEDSLEERLEEARRKAWQSLRELLRDEVEEVLQ